MTSWLAISLGDVTGIGPEVTLKAVASALDSDDASRFLLIGDIPSTLKLHRALGFVWSLESYQTGSNAAGGRVFIRAPFREQLPSDLPPGAPVAAQAAIASLREGAALSLSGKMDGLVTAPVNKEAIVRSGQPFIGQTEFLSELAGTKKTAMMLLGSDERGRWLRVALAT